MERKMLFRLCHVCDTLNEAETEVLRCEKCGKGFLPIKYFDKIRTQALKESESASGPVITISLNPINGLIVFW